MTPANGAFSTNGHFVIVGASLAGLRAAESLRKGGFNGRLTLIGDEPYEPYDRPPLSKQVLTVRVAPESTTLPQARGLDVEWRLGTPAVGLDLAGKRVRLADGAEVGFDRLLIATGTRARPWPNPAEAAFDGVVTLRSRDDTARLRRELSAGPRRVLVIGAGFTGSEIASACRELGLPVTVTERAATPLAGALGGAIGAFAARMQREQGVDLRCGVSVTSLEATMQVMSAVPTWTTAPRWMSTWPWSRLARCATPSGFGTRASGPDRAGSRATPGAACSTCTA
jgi:NADPH-dependent 2,4-dienoyl-CoA reductase/sulfur reductase-like enzyme